MSKEEETVNQDDNNKVQISEMDFYKTNINKVQSQAIE